MRLGEILVRSDVLTEARLAEALQAKRHPDERLGQVLVRLGFATEEQVARALAEQAGLPYVDIEQVEIQADAATGIPVQVLVRRQVMPLRRDNGELTMVVGDPLDLEAVEELRVLSGCPVQTVVGRPTEIARALRRRFGIGADSLSEMGTSEVEILREEGDSGGDLVQMAEDAALIRFVNQILLEALRQRASDVHLEPYENQLRVRYRVDGVLHDAEVPTQIKRYQAAILSRIKIMANLNIAEKRMPQDGRIHVRVGGREIDIRVSILPAIHGEGAVLRILDRSSLLLSLEDIGMSADILTIFHGLIRLPNGIFLVTGPTGSGKTTTLYAALQKINAPDTKILTVEDPVEYELGGVTQIQVHPAIGLTFAAGLRSILRHDPDVLLVGEIRDLETAQIAVQASLTGHFVFSTLHTNDSAGALTRLVDMGVEPYLVSSAVEGMMAQRLVRRICSRCGEDVPPEDLQRVRSEIPADLEGCRRGAGCEACLQTGYRGRQGIFELMVMTEPLREMVLRGDSAGRIRKTAAETGMKFLRDQGWSAVRRGITTVEEVLRVTKEQAL